LAPAYNWDTLKHPRFKGGVSKALQDQKAVISQVVNYDLSPDNDFIGSRQWASHIVGPDGDPTEPLVVFFYPMLDTAADGDADPSEEFSANVNSTVVGIMASTFSWGSFLTNILPEGENGIVVVFANACNQSFTYLIDGPGAQYLGQGDLHDSKYDSMRRSSSLNRMSLFNSGSSQYTGLFFDDDFCPYTVSAYPSEDLESAYRTYNPIIFTLTVVAIFAFTALVFFAYDKLVTVRQQKVMTTAQKSNAIVSSLFPSNVRDRLLESNGGAGGSLQPAKAKLKSFLNGGAYSMDDEPGTGFETSKPIADLFTECTVLFADIANFTAWSSVREPGQVFTLLETVYGAFDVLAARRGVFKVEVRATDPPPLKRSDAKRQMHTLIVIAHTQFYSIHSLPPPIPHADYWRFVRERNGPTGTTS
jgi:hypothetical protein